MVKSLIGGLLVAGVLLLGATKDSKDQGWKPTPLMRTVTPDTAKIGDQITVVGEYLDKARVSEIYLTDGKNEIKMTIVEQSETTVKVKVPDNVKPGRMRLMVLTTGPEPQFLEQPVSISIE
jgi:IPT/TIG domain